MTTSAQAKMVTPKFLQISTLHSYSSVLLTRIHRFIQVDGVRTAEGCEGVTGAIIRA